MLSRVDQTIIIVQTYFYKNVVIRELSVKYSFGQGRAPLLMSVVDILLGMLMYRPSLSLLFVRLFGAREFEL
jgi:hypothetical protein